MAIKPSVIGIKWPPHELIKIRIYVRRIIDRSCNDERNSVCIIAMVSINPGLKCNFTVNQYFRLSMNE